MEIEGLQCLRINCPEWFEREDFRAWLKARAGLGLATWHPTDGEVGELSDVFLVYDHGECGDTCDDDFPAEVWAEVNRLADQAGFEYGVLWLSPVE